MADKTIEQLNPVERIKPTDLFVCQQDGSAKKVSGQDLENWLLEFAGGHGGVLTIDSVGSSGLINTYRITLVDGTYKDFDVINGKAITQITQFFATSAAATTLPGSWSTSMPLMTTTNKYLWSYIRFMFNDGSHIDTGKGIIGVYGDTGRQTYVHIKWSSVPNPTSSDMGNIPDDYIGIYTGVDASAPTSPSAYKWYRQKGAVGDKGDNATVIRSIVEYQVSTSSTVAPSSWEADIPVVPQGRYLWTRVTIEFNSGAPIVYYSISRNGLDGSGAVLSVNGLSGNVLLTARDINTSSGKSVQEELRSISDLATGALKNDSGSVKSTNIAPGAVTFGKIAAGTINLLYQNVTVFAGAEYWVEDDIEEWSSDYPYRYDLALTGVTENYIPECIFAYKELQDGSIYGCQRSYDGGISIWASDIPRESFVIPQIEARRVRE